MNHAISNVGASEAAYERSVDRSYRLSLVQERIENRAEQIIDSFDAKDAAAVIDLIAEKNPQMFAELCEALAILPSLNPYSLEDQRFARLVVAFKGAASYYAGYTAAEELSA